VRGRHTQTPREYSGKVRSENAYVNLNIFVRRERGKKNSLKGGKKKWEGFPE